MLVPTMNVSDLVSEVFLRIKTIGDLDFIMERC